MNYRLVNSNAYLMHYGVKGMKWGVRKEYVPKGRKRSRNTDGAVMDYVLENPGDSAYYAICAFILLRFGAKRVSDLNKQGWFTEKYTASDVKRCHTSKEEDLKIVNTLPGLDNSTVEKLAYISSVTQLSKPEQDAINKVLKDGWMDNCVYCTTAGALRRKGYDVEAKNSPGRGHSHEQTMKWWKGSKIENFRGESESNPRKAERFQTRTERKEAKSKRSADEQIAHMTRVLESQGVGAYGDLRLFGFFCGHSTEYSVEKDGVKIHDNQVKHTYNSLAEYMKYHPHFEPHNSTFIRLDNCEPDLDRILKEHAVKPRGK